MHEPPFLLQEQRLLGSSLFSSQGMFREGLPGCRQRNGFSVKFTTLPPLVRGVTLNKLLRRRQKNHKKKRQKVYISQPKPEVLTLTKLMDEVVPSMSQMIDFAARIFSSKVTAAIFFSPFVCMCVCVCTKSKNSLVREDNARNRGKNR